MLESRAKHTFECPAIDESFDEIIQGPLAQASSGAILIAAVGEYDQGHLRRRAVHAAHRLQRIGMRKRQIEEDDLWICDFERGNQRGDGGNVGQFQAVLTLRVELAQSCGRLTGISFCKQYAQFLLVHVRCLPFVGARGESGSRAARTAIDSNPVSVHLRRHFIASQLNSRDWRGQSYGQSTLLEGGLSILPQRRSKSSKLRMS